MKGKGHLLPIFHRKKSLLLALTGEDFLGLRKNGGNFEVRKEKVFQPTNSMGNLAIILPLPVKILQINHSPHEKLSN